MKIFLLIIVFACANLFSEALNLKDCISEVKTYNKKLKSTKSKILYAEAVKRQSLSYLLPHFEAEGRYELKNEGRDYSVFTEYGSAFSSKTIGVNAHLLLFDFFSSWNKYKAARCEVQISQKNLENQLLELEKEVKIAFFKVLENESLAKVIEDDAKRLEKQLILAQESQNMGIGSKADILAVKLQLTEQKKNLLHANSEILQSKIFLNYLLGREMLSPLTLIEPSLDSYPNDLEMLQKNALENRCDLKALKKKIRSLNFLLKSAREAFAPNFFAIGDYHYLEDAPPSSSAMENNNDKNWVSFGIGMKFSLFDGGRNLSEMRKVKAQIAEAQAELEDLEKNILMEVNQEYLKCKETSANISIDEQAVSLAEEKFNFISERYKQGMDSTDSMLKADHELIKAKMNKNRAIYMYHISCAHLNKASGGI